MVLSDKDFLWHHKQSQQAHTQQGLFTSTSHCEDLVVGPFVLSSQKRVLLSYPTSSLQSSCKKLASRSSGSSFSIGLDIVMFVVRPIHVVPLLSACAPNSCLTQCRALVSFTFLNFYITTKCVRVGIFPKLLG